MNLSTLFHPQTNGQAKHTIQTFEDMLRTCVIDFKGKWYAHLPLISSLTTIVIIRVSKWPHMNIFMGEDADLLLGGSKLGKQG